MRQLDLSIIRDHLAKSKAFSSLFFDFATEDLSLKEKATKDLALGVITEAMSVLDAVNWKVHHGEKFPVSRSNLLEQLIDVYKYLMSIASLWNFTPQEWQEEFERKDLVNWQRYRQDTTIKTLTAASKVAAIDIDGVLCAYPENIIAFMNRRFAKVVTLKDIKSLHGVEDAYLEQGVKASDYRLARLDFLEEGWYSKYSPVMNGASEFTHKLKDLGYTIVLLSSRPYEKHHRIFGDTVEWCQANKIAFDIIYWDKDKDMRIIKTFPNLRFLLDDDVDNVREVAKAGYLSILFERPYNRRSLTTNFLIASTYDEVIGHLTEPQVA
jgi:uncharacterized HAD superfamily protein